MSISDVFNRISERRNEKKRLMREAEDQLRTEKIISDKSKSANERELERFMKEEREEMIKERLEYYRKARQRDINFNHNPLDIPNITNHVEWQVLKEKNIFANNKNMFANQPNIHKSNPKLFKNNKKLFSI